MEFYDTANELLNDNHSQVRDLSVYLKKPKPPQLYSPIWGIKTLSDDWHWYGTEFWYLKTTKAEMEKYIQSLPVPKQRLYRQAQETVRKAESEKLEQIKFDVFLPQWPQNL